MLIMTDIGNYALVLALVMTFYSAVVSGLGAKIRRVGLIESAERGVYAATALLTVTVLALLYALVTRDFQIEYVAEYTDASLPLFYTLTALWAGQAGSLLFWGWLLVLFAAIVIYQNRKRNSELTPYVVTIIMSVAAFFVLLLVFSTPPFERLPLRPQDGQGLNPMLQNPGMIIHPPTLYLGYVGFTIPFAFALAALITGRLGSQWITSTRRWTLFSWFFLTLGNLFGAQWAYVELGWGGYWAWDPVENASFMPWLVGTAYLHSVMIQERRGMLKIWNMMLIVITFALTIFGTFITRSGIISSVHSFGLSNLGPFFLIFLGIILLVSFWLLFKRWDDLKSEHQLDALLSRESSFLFNNLILLGMAFAVFWGTIFPMISEAVKGVKITVGPPFFNQVSVPIALILLLLTGLCPLVGWRRTSAHSLRRNFRYPTAAAVVGGGMLFVLGIRQLYALVSLILSIFVATSIAIEFYRGGRARQKIAGTGFLRALYTLVARNKRRYGGYIIHLGMVMIFVGITGSSAFKSSVQATLKKGESVKIKNYEIKYENLSRYPTENKLIVSATLAVFDHSERIDTLTPAKEFYARREQPSTEVAIRSTLKEDLYTILVGYDEDSATFKILVNPLVKWFWIGGYVLTLGTLIAMGQKKRKLAEI